MSLDDEETHCRFSFDLKDVRPIENPRFKAVYLRDDGSVTTKPVIAEGLVGEQINVCRIVDGKLGPYEPQYKKPVVIYEGVVFCRKLRCGENFMVARSGQGFVSLCPMNEEPEEFLAEDLAWMRKKLEKRPQCSDTLDPSFLERPFRLNSQSYKDHRHSVQLHRIRDGSVLTQTSQTHIRIFEKERCDSATRD